MEKFTQSNDESISMSNEETITILNKKIEDLEEHITLLDEDKLM